ncbi:MAG: 50S ribosomal protein L5 [Candidatus Cloacimonadales bacterium]
MSRLQETYKNEVVPALMKHFEYKNVNMVPQLVKISVNMGVGQATENKAILDNAVKDLTQITGRKPIVTKAKKAISNFKLREGMPIGTKVTLRGEIMYEFLDRLINLVMPRIRDFRGISAKSFDGRGNYTVGLNDQTVFPEIEYDKIDAVRGMDITIVTTAENDEEGRELLRQFGMPFKKNQGV